MLILPESLEHEWADELLLLWAARRETRLSPPAGCRRRHTDPGFDPGKELYCYCCSTWLPPDAFWRKPQLTRGYERTCKKCRAGQALANRKLRTEATV